MQELRDMNQIEMDSDDKEKRWKEANTPKRVSTHTDFQWQNAVAASMTHRVEQGFPARLQTMLTL